MNVLLYLYYPFFEGHLAGGVPVSMREVLKALVARGFRFRVLCAAGDEYPYVSGDGLEVRPVLDELPDDSPSPHEERVMREIVRATEGMDVVWSVDRRFPVPVSQRLVLSLNALCYPNETGALLGGGWDHLLVPSGFALREAERLLLEHGEALDGRGRSVASLPVPPRFRPSPVGAALAEKIGYDPRRRYVIFPHRPEEGKGHELALRVLLELLRADDRYHLLIPAAPRLRYVDIPSEAAFVNRLKERVSLLGLEPHVTIHEWVEYEHLPQYLSLGECCLFLSTLPETFGLSLVQAIACGTFVVSSGSGALGEVVPHGYGHVVVPRLEPEIIARHVLEGTGAGALARGREHVTSLYTPGRSAQQFAAGLRPAGGG